MDALASEGGLCESEIAPEYSGDAVKSAKSAFFDCFFWSRRTPAAAQIARNPSAREIWPFGPSAPLWDYFSFS